MEFSKRYSIEGRMVCLDFKKAFDTVNRDFLFRTLSVFGFGPSFIQWLHTCYKNVSSCVLNKTLRSVHFGVVVMELINCKCGGIVRNQIW